MQMKTRTELEAELIARVADDEDFRARFLESPKEVIQEVTGVAIPEDFNVQVHEESSMTVHLVLPPSDRLTQDDLAAVAGGMGQMGLWGG